MRRPTAPSLIFDDECRVCNLFASLVRLADFKGIRRVIPFQSRIAGKLLKGQTRDKGERSVHLVMPDGRVSSADEALR